MKIVYTVSQKSVSLYLIVTLADLNHSEVFLYHFNGK